MISKEEKCLHFSSFLLFLWSFMFDRVIEDIVLEDFASAKVLFQEGIPFYDVSAFTLKEACQQYQIDYYSLEKKLVQNHTASIPDQATSIEDILCYLTESHRTFIKQSLPYYSNLIENSCVSQFEDQQVAKDLQFIFPLFVEDFIRHVLEEEKTMFRYITTLIEASNKQSSLSKAYMLMQQKSIASFALDHLHDDPLEGIRKLTKNYAFSERATVHEKVVMYELQQFDKDLLLHAKIEDQLLFSKALVIEQKVKQAVNTSTSLN